MSSSISLVARNLLITDEIRELLADYGYSGIKTQEHKRSTKKEKLTDVAVDKDRKIRELRTRVEKLEKECELLRGKVFLLI